MNLLAMHTSSSSGEPRRMLRRLQLLLLSYKKTSDRRVDVVRELGVTSHVVDFPFQPCSLSVSRVIYYQSMSSADYLAKVSEPTCLVNLMVMIEKRNCDVRICIYPKYLNKAIK